jgi:AraC family transcriptional regulator, arabinose operon regulatory protein
MNDQTAAPAEESVPAAGAYLREVIFPESGQYPVEVVFLVSKVPSSAALYHDALEIKLFLRGKGLYFLRDRNYGVQANSVLVIHENEFHNHVSEADSCLELYNFAFYREVLASRSGAVRALQSLSDVSSLRLTEKEAAQAEVYARNMEEELRIRPPAWQDMVASLLEALLIILERAAERGVTVAQEDNLFTRQAISFIEDRLTQRLTLSDVAAHVQMSPAYFSRMFKKYVGVGFQEYTIHRRVARAKSLLEQSDLKVAAIARTVGFVDVTTFNRNFRLLTGFTPSKYRTLHTEQ